MNQDKYLIEQDSSIRSALIKLNTFSSNDGLTLFVINKDEQLLGTLTDGDIRRGLLDGAVLDDVVSKVMNPEFKFLVKGSHSQLKIKDYRSRGIELLPQIDSQKKIVKIINLEKAQAILPLDVVIMAGGKGERLRPLTINTPKPLLLVGEKPIIEHNVDRLIEFGVDNIYISINYLGHLIVDHFKDGSSKNVSIKYIEENKPLGTIGAVGLIQDFLHEHVLIMNSDLLTNINWEDFYISFIDADADMMIAAIPYQVQIPYAVLETNSTSQITSLKEKPTYTYYSNAGIYLIKKEFFELIPENEPFNATHLVDMLISQEKKVFSYAILDYWLDIGRHDDYKKANEDIRHLKM